MSTNQNSQHMTIFQHSNLYNLYEEKCIFAYIYFHKRYGNIEGVNIYSRKVSIGQTILTYLLLAI